MPSVRRKWDPDKISDKADAKLNPLRLIRNCIRELWGVIENPVQIFGGGAGTTGTGSGPASELATRIQVDWVANGPYRVDDSVDGAWVVPTACEVSKLYLWRGTAGTSGSTVIDLNRNGSTMYVTQANRPTLDYDAGEVTPCNLPDDVTLVAGDVVTIDCDEKDSGLPMNFRLTLEAA